MKIKDTLRDKKIKIKKNKENHMFVCGPTVYDYSHIGHARTYLIFDLFVKYLKSQDFKIKYVQNITNIDDKIIERGKEQNKNPLKIADKFEKKYYQDMKSLGIDTVDHYVKATDVIPEIISQVKKLIKKGFAYQTKTGIYFKVRKFKDYGKLSNQDIDALKSGNRIETKEDKEDPLDFALWKLNQPEKEIKENKEQPIFINNEPAWESPWGWGRPGWHIEDTAISEKFFGPQYEIHGGAEDLKFPHHESEIAQQEAASGKKPFVKIWMHTGFLTVDSKKMGKSLHNFITIRDFLKNHSPETLRFMVMSHHYRSRFDYTEKAANEAKESLESIKTFVHKTQFTAKNTDNQNTKDIKREIQKAKDNFHQSIQNDFNTPQALGILFKLIKKYQDKVWSLSSKDAKNLGQFITNTMEIFGFSAKEHRTPKKIQTLIKKRNKLRTNKQFIKSDKLREKIQALGYEIEDTPLGSFTHKIKENNNG